MEARSVTCVAGSCRSNSAALANSSSLLRSSPAKVLDLSWSTRFRVHHRIAKSYRHRSLFVIGDAAHVHSPAGSQGMNTVLIDAVVLGEVLGDVINGIRAKANSTFTRRFAVQRRK